MAAAQDGAGWSESPALGVAAIVSIALVLAAVMKLRDVLLWLLAADLDKRIAAGVAAGIAAERRAQEQKQTSGLQQVASLRAELDALAARLAGWERRFGDGEHSLLGKLEATARVDPPRELRMLRDELAAQRGKLEALQEELRQGQDQIAGRLARNQEPMLDILDQLREMKGALRQRPPQM